MADPQANRWARYDLWDERQLSLDRFAAGAVTEETNVI